MAGSADMPNTASNSMASLVIAPWWMVAARRRSARKSRCPSFQHSVAEVSATTADEKPHHPQSYYRENEKKFHIVSAVAEGDDHLAKSDAE